MGKSKLALALGLLLCLNVIFASARPSWDEEEEENESDNFFGNSDEKSEEEQDNLPPPAPRAIPPPPPPPVPVAPAKQPQVSEESDWPSFGDSEEEKDQVDSHSHHHGHHQQPKQALNNPPVDQQKSIQQPPAAPVPISQNAPTQWGSNQVGFNESCAQATCNPNSFLTCSTDKKVCTCIDNYAYIRSQERCFPIPTGNQPCEFNDQCHAGHFGRLSRCDRSVARCECYDIDMSGKREVVMVKGVCHIKKYIYDPCVNTTECASIQGQVICDFPDASVDPGRETKQCRCDRGHYWDILHKECFKIATDGLTSDCTSDDQCKLGNLGEMSRCSKQTLKCECHDVVKPGQEHVVYYKPQGKCYGRKDWNDTCRIDDECRASISSKAECLPNPDGTQENTCQCPAGKTCPRDVDDGDSAFLVGNSGLFTITAFVATLVYARL